MSNKIEQLRNRAGENISPKTIAEAVSIDNNTNIKQYIDNSIQNTLSSAASALRFKGVIGTEGDIYAAAEDPTTRCGDVYRIQAEVPQFETGDLVIFTTDATEEQAASFTIAQANLTGAIINPSALSGDSFDGLIPVFDSATQVSSSGIAASDIVTKDQLAALTDNDIKLSEQFTITKDFGYYKLDGAASKKVGTVGQSLHNFLQGALAEEDKTIFNTSPSCSISISSYSAEIGTTFSPTASWSTGAGSYKWGTFKDGTADFTDKDTGITYDKGTITLTPASITLTEAAQTVTASGTATRSAVTQYPCSNLGNDISNNLAAEYKAEKEISLAPTKNFTGYRPNFYGFITSLDDKLTTLDSTTLTSVFIRGLTNQGATTTPLSAVTPPAKWVQFLYAVPAGRKNSIDAQDDYTKLPCAKATTHADIEIEHAGGVKSMYTVFVISNDALADANKMNLTWS